jgi:hypothetical protein
VSDDCERCAYLEGQLRLAERELSLAQTRLVKEFSTLKQSEVVALHEKCRQIREARSEAQRAVHSHRFKQHNGEYDHG